MKRLGWVLVCGVVLGIGYFSLSGHSEPVGGVRKFMRPKLDHSQKVLEGLTLEDFGLVAEHAKRLLTLSEAAEWQVLPGPEYVRYSSDFQRLCNELIQAANKKNIDGATLSYVQLTMNCINCHKHVREAMRIADVK